MPLNEATLVVQFAKGVSTKKDRKGVMEGELLALENAVFTKAVSLVKRFGYEDLGAVVVGSDAPLPAPIALGRRQYELIALTGTEAYSYVDDLSAWALAGDVQSVVCDHEQVCKTGSNQTLADMSSLSGIAVYAWEDSSGGVWYAVLNDYTGRTLVAPTQVDSGGQRPRVHSVGQFIHVYWVRTASQEVRVLRIDPTAPTTAPVESIILTNIDGASPFYDVDTDDSKAVIAWRNTDSEIGVAYVHQDGGIGGVGVGLPIPVVVEEFPQFSVSVAIDKTHDDRRIAVAWSDTSAMYVVLDSDLAEEFAPRTIATGDMLGAHDLGSVVFLRDDNEDGHRQIWLATSGMVGPQVIRRALVDSNPSVFTVHETGKHLGLGMGSKLFLDDGEAYYFTQFDSTLFKTYYCLRVNDSLAVARLLPGLGGGRPTKNHLPSVSDEIGENGRAVRFAAVDTTDVASAEGLDVFAEHGLRRVSLDFLSPDAFRSVQLGRSTYMAGGFVQVYDGERWQEAGFHYGPDDVSDPTLDAPTTGPGLPDGTYGYVFVYENPLANGELERGPTSALVLVEVTGGPRQVMFSIPTYRWPSKPHARIGVFRSTDGDASAFFRASSLDPSTLGDVNGFVANIPIANTVIFVDEMDDVTLLQQEPLYTNGGIPANDPLGAARLIATGKNRLLFVDSSTPLTVNFSQELAKGISAEMAPELFFDVDPFGGDINGLIVMDDAIVVFKETAIFIVEGPGPLADPATGGGFSQPQLVTSDVGCLSPDSLVYSPVGVAFQSQKGIYLLGRDRSVTYVGAPVEAYNGQRIVAATLIENRTQIRFLTDSGRTLLYDYLFGQWSTFTGHEGQDAVVVDGDYYYVRNNGQVMVEVEGSYRDDNSQIRMGLETAWLKLAGHLQGWQFLWFVTIIGEWKSDHKQRMYIAFDYEEGWFGSPIEIDPAEARVTAPYGDGAYGDGPYGGSNDTRYQFEVHVGQECEAVRFRFEDVEPTGEFGASFELTELILTGGVQRSTYGMEESRRY